MEDVTTAIPPRVRGHVQYALGTLRRWEETVEAARLMERVAQQPGRYEYDIRYGLEGASLRESVAKAEGVLLVFAALATANGVDAAAALEAFGGRPPASEEGEAVCEWAPSRR